MEYAYLSQDDIIRLFTDSEIHTGSINCEDELSTTISILYKCIYTDNTLNFLLYDFNNLFFCIQTQEEIETIIQKENSSIEFTGKKEIIDFIVDNLFRSEKNTTIVRSKYFLLTEGHNTFLFENLVDIVKIRWRFDCQEFVVSRYNGMSEDVNINY